MDIWTTRLRAANSQRLAHAGRGKGWTLAAGAHGGVPPSATTVNATEIPQGRGMALAQLGLTSTHAVLPPKVPGKDHAVVEVSAGILVPVEDFSS